VIKNQTQLMIKRLIDQLNKYLTIITKVIMYKGKFMYLLMFVLMLSFITACEKYYADNSSDTGQSDDVTGTEAADDYVWDNSDIIEIVLNGTGITEYSDSVSVIGSNVTITSAGTYRLIGTLTDGQIIVDSEDEKIVRLILNGVNIKCSTSAAIYIKKAAKAMIVLADNSVNYLTDGTSYILNTDNEPSAAIFSI
jgi:hypothetical protein